MQCPGEQLAIQVGVLHAVVSRKRRVMQAARRVLVISGVMQAGDLHAGKASADAQIGRESAPGHGKVVVAVHGNGAHLQGVDQSAGIGVHRRRGTRRERRTIVKLDAGEVLADAVSLLSKTQLNPSPPKPAPGRKLKSRSAVKVDVVVPAIPANAGNRIRVIAGIIRIAEGIPIPTLLLQRRAPTRPNTNPQVPIRAAPAHVTRSFGKPRRRTNRHQNTNGRNYRKKAHGNRPLARQAFHKGAANPTSHSARYPTTWS